MEKAAARFAAKCRRIFVYRIRIWILYNVPKEGFIMIDFETAYLNSERSTRHPSRTIFLRCLSQGSLDWRLQGNPGLRGIYQQEDDRCERAGYDRKEKDFTSLPYSKAHPGIFCGNLRIL